MAKHLDPRRLDEIITENALLWIRRTIASRRILKREYFLNTLATEMLPFIISEAERSAPDFNQQMAMERISRSLKNYLGIAKRDKISWRVEYVEAFAGAMGLPVNELWVPAPPLDEDEQELLASMDLYAPWLAKADRHKMR